MKLKKISNRVLGSIKFPGEMQTFYLGLLITVLLVSSGFGAFTFTTGPDDLTEEMARKIWQSPERKHLDQVRMESLRLIDSALRRDVSKEDMIGAFKSASKGDSKVLDALLFPDQEQADNYYATLASAQQALLARFPVQSIIHANSDGGTVCSVSVAPEQRVNALFSIVSDDGSGFEKVLRVAKANAEAAAPCGDSWASYFGVLACLAGCGVITPAGGVPAAMCAWGCVCMVCPELAEKIGLPGLCGIRN